MHAGCQERYVIADVPIIRAADASYHVHSFKHTIPPQSAIDAFKPPFPPPDNFEEEAPSPYISRINITFRFYRPDFRPDSIPRCHCGVPTILRPAMKQRGPPSSVENHVQRSCQSDSETIKYHWMCYAGAQREGQSCKFYQVLDMEAEGRGAKQGVSHTAFLSLQRSKSAWSGLLGPHRSIKLATLRCQLSPNDIFGYAPLVWTTLRNIQSLISQFGLRINSSKRCNDADARRSTTTPSDYRL